VRPQPFVRNETNQLAEVISHAAPAFHGLYRAVISTSFSWSITEWLQLSRALSDLLDADLVEHVGNHLTAAINSPQEQAILSRYICVNRPLTGYFILCCIMEIEWTVLAQSLQPAQECIVHTEEEAAAANAAWSALAGKKVASPPQVKGDIGGGLRQSINVAMQCFTDLLTQLESLETEPSSDTYAWETIAESIVSDGMPSIL
jgi:phosphatidylinositol 4-kinase